MADNAPCSEMQADKDGLTGLNSHRSFHEELSRLCRTQAFASLLMVDIDHFRSFNENFGHPAGDDVLQSLAAVLTACVRTDDFVARYGGDQFTVIVRGCDQDQALALAERIRAAVQVLPTNHRQAT